MPTQPPDWLIPLLKSLQPKPDPIWVRILNTTDQLVKTGAVIVGGVWAYYKFVKGRLYRPRLEVSAMGEVFTNTDRDFVIISLTLKNVGTSKIEIRQKGTALRIFSCSENSSSQEPVDGVLDWERIETVSIFEQHGWIESSETISDKILASLPPNQIAVLLQVRIVGQGLEWSAKNIVKLDRQHTSLVTAVKSYPDPHSAAASD